jgi:HxlR-like helix-turn-helix
MIIHQFLGGTKRFNQLQRELSGITHRTLAKQLWEMEQNGPDRAPGLQGDSAAGRILPRSLRHDSLKDILWAMHVWAEVHGPKLPR